MGFSAAARHLVIDSDGNFEASVSGGCLESAIIAEALDVIDSGEPKMPGIRRCR